MTSRPTGTVAFLFTDIEGSTRTLQQVGDAYIGLLADHHRLIRTAIATWGGYEVSTEGDAFFVVFASALDAVRTAADAQQALGAHAWPDGISIRVRMGIHAGEASVEGDDYVGLDIHRAARIAAAAHGGQVLISDSVRQLTAGRLGADLALRDLGVHRLRDIDGAEHLYQLVAAGLRADFPPIRSASARFRVLPTDPTTFVGRRPEVERARALLAGTRLLTLTGPGGTGKTRLSLEIAEAVEADFADGVVFVPLAALTDPQLVASTIRHVLGYQEQGGRPSIEIIVDAIAEREVLLVLDNFEQVLPAAVTVARLLEATSVAKVVVTSRAPLHIFGEQELPVPPLQLPDVAADDTPEALLASEAGALFVARARAVRPDFQLTPANVRAIVQICIRLDGLPLAIELAASRVRLLPPEALLLRLGRSLDLLSSTAADRTDRQRTLRGAIDWSYELLEAPTRLVFRRLSVFVGGWGIEDAEGVVGASASPAGDLFDELGRLIDHSLVHQDAHEGEPRFGMLETIREYGRELLDAAGETPAIERAHATWFLELVLRLAPSFSRIGPELVRAEQDHDNIRAALRWAIDHGETESALSASGAMWRFWHLRGHLREGLRLSREALALPGADAPTPGRARALYGLGSLAYWLADYPAARTGYLEALSVARVIGDSATEAEALYALGFLYDIERDYAAARAAFEESRLIAERINDPLAVANAMFGTAFTDRLEGRIDEALAIMADVLPRYEAVGDTFATVNAYGVIGRILQAAGDLEAGRGYHLRELTGAVAIGDRTMVAMALSDLASLEATAGRFEIALRLHGTASRETERVGGKAPDELTLVRDPRVLARAAGYAEADIETLIQDGRGLSDDAAVRVANGL